MANRRPAWVDRGRYVTGNDYVTLPYNRCVTTSCSISMQWRRGSMEDFAMCAYCGRVNEAMCGNCVGCGAPLGLPQHQPDL